MHRCMQHGDLVGYTHHETVFGRFYVSSKYSVAEGITKEDSHHLRPRNFIPVFIGIAIPWTQRVENAASRCLNLGSLRLAH